MLKLAPRNPRYAGGVKPADLRWGEIEASLWQCGYAKLPPLLTAAACAALIALYPRRELFRSRIEMARYHFGVGEHQYFDYPLPEIVRELRERSYPPLAAIVNRWGDALGDEIRFPAGLAQFTAQCQAAGQRKATPSCCTTKRAATTACIRTFMATWRSRCSPSAS
jgi:hypothetical protein